MTMYSQGLGKYQSEYKKIKSVTYVNDESNDIRVRINGKTYEFEPRMTLLDKDRHLDMWSKKALEDFEKICEGKEIMTSRLKEFVDNASSFLESDDDVRLASKLLQVLNEIDRNDSQSILEGLKQSDIRIDDYMDLIVQMVSAVIFGATPYKTLNYLFQRYPDLTVNRPSKLQELSEKHPDKARLLILQFAEKLDINHLGNKDLVELCRYFASAFTGPMIYDAVEVHTSIAYMLYELDGPFGFITDDIKLLKNTSAYAKDADFVVGLIKIIQQKARGYGMDYYKYVIVLMFRHACNPTLYGQKRVMSVLKKFKCGEELIKLWAEKFLGAEIID